MKIVLAKAAGFCMGVRRAMDIVLHEASQRRGTVLTHGPLIHNTQVVETLQEPGIGILDKSQPVRKGSTVVIRAHGVPPDENRTLEEMGYRVVDATCPHVIRIQRLIARHVQQGESIVIVGDHGHAEVQGLLSHAQGRGHVVATEEDIDALPADIGPVCAVSQTTQSAEHYDRLIARIRDRWPDATIHRTICNATDKRQRETVEIAREVDAMIVVGGRHSANTVRLAELAAATGTPTYHIEKADEIDYTKLGNVEIVGVTAGASTPKWMIIEVTERLQEYARRRWGFAARTAYNALSILIDTNLFLALGALAMGYGIGTMLGTPFPLPALFAASLYIFAMYSVNIRTQGRIERYTNPLRWHFYQRWGGLLIVIGASSLPFSLALSWALGQWAFGLMLFAVLAGALYRLNYIPSPMAQLLRHRQLTDIPASKDVFMGLAWATVLAILPVSDRLSSIPQLWGAAVAFLFVFTLVFVRSVIVDLRDIQGDQIIGRETIPMVLGKRWTKILLVALTGFTLIALIAATGAGALTTAGYLMTVPVLYTWVYLYLYHRRAIQRGLHFETILGGKFLLVGLLALLWNLMAR